MTNPPPARRRRRWWKVLAAGLIAAVLALFALPWVIGSGPGRAFVSRRIDRALATGRLKFDGLRVSWSGPTRIDEFTLLDPEGHRVASGRSAVIDRGLLGLISRRGGPITLTLDGASLEVERSRDGSIDLVEALRGLIRTPDPDRDVVVRIVGGKLRFRDPALAEPVSADSVDLNLEIAPSPRPVSWDLKLGKGDAGLEVRGEFDAWAAKGGPAAGPDLEVGIVARRWPVAVGTPEISGTGRLDGSADVARKRGAWKLSGDARALGLALQGPALRGDSLALDQIDAGWDIARSDEGWSIRRLGVTSPFGEVRAEGQFAAPSGIGKRRIEGRLDLAAIARQLPRALRLRDGLKVERGSARLAVDIESAPGRSTYEIDARLADLAARDGDRPFTLRDPATLTGRVVGERSGAVRVERLALKSAFLDVTAGGSPEEDQGVTLAGSLDLAAFRRQVGEWVDLGKLDLAGHADLTGRYHLRPFGTEPPPPPDPAGVRPARKADGSPWEPLYDVSLNAKIRDLRVEGVGPSPIRADSALLESGAIGPADSRGVPTGSIMLNLALMDGMRVRGAKLDLYPKPGSTVARFAAWGPSPTLRLARSLSAQVKGEWSPEARAFAIDTAQVVLMRNPDDPPGPRLAFLAKGRLDLGSGDLTLQSAPTDLSTAFAIGPDGLRVSGIGEGLAGLRFDGSLVGDLAPFGLGGRWSALASARGDGDGVQLSARVAGDPPAGSGRPNSLALRAHYAPGGDRIDLSEFTVATGFGTLDASGKLEDPSGSRRLDLRGTLAPDFAAITSVLAERVEPGAKVEGGPRKFRASGAIGEGSGWLDNLDAEVGFDLAGADVYGMKLGATPVILRADRGKLRFEPIETTLNEGHVRLEPEVDLGDPAGPTLRLGKNSTIREARINDEVSRRVLAYVAPILDRATRASGLVSVDLDHAEFPIGPGRGRQAKVDGAVVFQDVEFAPGPLASDLLGAVGRRESVLKLDRPVTLTIADGRVNQRGLAIPIGGLTRIELAGWVDFDRNLALTASLPVTPAMLGNNDLLADIAAGASVKLPITGTLDHPKIDRDAMADGLRDLGKSLLTRGAARGALELLRRIGQPRDPNAPPPPTAEERKALRQERKAEKKARREGMPPDPGP